MNVVLWIVAGLLALAFLAAGGLKLARTKEQLAASGMGWVEDFSPQVIKAIGALEVLGAVGLIVPAAVGVAPVLSALAAAGLAAVMVGAILTHARRREAPMIAVNAVLLALALFVAIERFGPEKFTS